MRLILDIWRYLSLDLDMLMGGHMQHSSLPEPITFEASSGLVVKHPQMQLEQINCMDDIVSLESRKRYKKQHADSTAAYITWLTTAMIIKLTMYVITVQRNVRRQVQIYVHISSK